MDNLNQAIALFCKELKLSSNLAERAMSQGGSTNQEYLYEPLKNEVKYRKGNVSQGI